MKYKIYRYALSEEAGHSASDNEKFGFWVEDAISPTRGYAVVTMRREEAEGPGPNPRSTLSECHRGYRGMIDARRFSAIAADGKNLEMYDQNGFQHDIAL